MFIRIRITGLFFKKNNKIKTRRIVPVAIRNKTYEICLDQYKPNMIYPIIRNVANNAPIAKPRHPAQ